MGYEEKPFMPAVSKRPRIPARNYTRMLILGLCAIVGWYYFVADSGSGQNYSSSSSGSGGGASKGQFWPGWKGIKHIVFFGDSYTSTSFLDNQPQPNALNPFGNPPLPGPVWQKRPTWADFIVMHYNQTFIKALNFAWGGATVNQAIIPQFHPSISSINDQVKKNWWGKYASRAVEEFQWKTADSLFVFWIGINDINASWLWDNTTEALTEDSHYYAGLVESVYNSGARNFLFLNTPPVERSPETLAVQPDYILKKKEWVNWWNEKTAELVHAFGQKHADATVFWFDAHKVYNEVLDDPCSHPETCGYKVLDRFCHLYRNDNEAKTLTSWELFYDECEYPLDKYFWLDQLHHTYPMQNVTAKGVAKLLSSAPANYRLRH